MQTVSSAFTAASGQNSTYHQPQYGANISWTKTENSSYHFFTIGTSSIGGNDFIPGSGSAPSFANQYAYTDYTQYMLSASVSRNIGQYTYGAFGANAELQMDNTSLLFTPGYDPIIGNYITAGRPLNLAIGFVNCGTISLFYGQSTAPMNDIGTRQVTLQAFDFFDYVQSYESKALGPIAAANNGCYVNLYANQIIGDLLAEAGLSGSQYIAEQSTQQPIGFYSPYGLFIGDIIQALCEAEQAIFFFDENGIAHFWNRQHIVMNDNPVWTFDETSTFELTPEDTPIINDVEIQANPRAVQATQQVWQQTAATEVLGATSTTVITNLCTNPSFEVNTTGWSTTGTGSIAQSATYAYVGSWSGYYVCGGGSSNYLTAPAFTCIPSTNYVAQFYVKGTNGVVVTANIVESATTLATQSVTLDGNWDLVSIASFASKSSGTVFALEIYTTTSSSVYVDAVMVQLATGASSAYFDGNTTYTSNYVYKWTSTANDSTSTATPCGIVTIEADFSDTNGALPVTSVVLPTYYSASSSTLTSNYQANNSSDGSGTDMESYIFIVGTSLINQPSDAATLTGSSYFITFANTYSQPIYVTQLTLFGTPAKVTYTINYEYQNQASIALYGDNPTNNGSALLIQNDLIQSPSTAQSNAIVLVTDYSTAYKRITADVTPVPQLQIGDTVTVGNNDITNTSYQPAGLLVSLLQQRQAYSWTASGLLLALMQPKILPIYTDYVIVGISHSFTDDAPMKQVLELEEKVLVTYFTIGISSIGGPDSLAPG